MDYFIIKGGKKLSGEINISGSKNAALPILFATLLTDEDVKLENVPGLADIKTSAALLELGGKKIDFKKSTCLIRQTKKQNLSEIPYDLVRKMRASILMAGPLLARRGHVKISLPGGCAIGVRPIDIHLAGFKQLGAEIILEAGYVYLKAKNGLKGSNVSLKFPSVGATENLIMAAVLAKGITIIENAAREPEISDLCFFLNEMGAEIKGIGTKKIKIVGVKKLNGASYRIIPDRIETCTFMIAAAITKGKIVLKNCCPPHCSAVIKKLLKTGLKIQCTQDSISASWVRPLRPASIKTEVYPGFPTDLQAQWMALMSTLKGHSKITESIFENRFMHVAELQRMGANLRIEGRNVFVNGVRAGHGLRPESRSRSHSGGIVRKGKDKSITNLSSGQRLRVNRG